MSCLVSKANREYGGLDLTTAVKSSSMDRQEHRIMVALGIDNKHIRKVNNETLYIYYRYLSKNLLFPFLAYYPEPVNIHDMKQNRCSVLELLDPNEYLGDEFDGIYCKTRKDKYEISLPLIELQVPQDSPNYQLIDDFWYWFWNWQY